MLKEKYENKDLCAKCGGKCCKKGGCQYAPTDFENQKFDYLLEKLNEGYISIVCALDYQKINGRLIPNPFLYVKSRNENRPIIDLLSFRTRCSCLTENGCIYDFEHRPSGGVNLIPVEGGKCYTETDPLEYIEMWQPHQQVLRKLVKSISGKSVEAKLKEDAYNLFRTILANDFNGVCEEELYDILNDIHLYIMTFPEEYQKAKNDHNQMMKGPIRKRTQ